MHHDSESVRPGVAPIGCGGKGSGRAGWRFPAMLWALAATLLLAAPPRAMAVGPHPGPDETVQYDTELVSRASGIDGAKGNFASSADPGSSPRLLSADGRYVVFSSFSSNLDPDDGQGNGTSADVDIYLRDRQTYETELVSRVSGADGEKGNSYSQSPSISGDGRYVVFRSAATNLSADDPDDNADIYVRDRQTSETILVNRANGVDGAKGNEPAFYPILSGNGRYVAFVSNATNLDPNAVSGNYEVFVRDLQASTTMLVSRASGIDGAEGNGISFYYYPSISADGRYVAFFSMSSNLHPDDPDTGGDVFVRDLEMHVTHLVSRADGEDGVKDNVGAGGPSISADGRYVAFLSSGTNLDPEDTDTIADLYVRDLQANTTTLASRASGPQGAKGNGNTVAVSISDDGRRVAFKSDSTNLDPDDPDDDSDIYVRDLLTDQTLLVSRASGADGVKGNDSSTIVSTSGDGRFVAFVSYATNLDPDDTDSLDDMYVRDVLGPTGEAHLDFLPASFDFGDVELGTTSAPLAVTLNNTGDLAITGLIFDPPGNGFAADTSDCGSSLAVLESCDIVVTYTPPGFGASAGTLTASNDQDAPATLELAGNGVGSPEAVLAFDPAALDFGDITVGTTSDALVATLHNSGTGAASVLTFTAPNAFTLDTSACGTSIGAGQMCDVAITFTPMSGGEVSAHLLLDSYEGISATLGLHGSGIIPPAPQLAFTPENFAFGEVEVGTSSAPQVATLHNSGDGDATGLTFNTPGSGFLADTANCGSTLAAGASCTVSVVFTPDATGGSDAALEASSSEGASVVLGTRMPPEKYLYFMSEWNRSIFRVDPADVGSARPVFTSADKLANSGFNGFDLAVDTQNCAYYWTNGDQLRRANIDGTDERVVYDSSNQIGSYQPALAFDAESGTLYFTEGTVEGDEEPETIFRAHAGPDGLTNVVEVLSTPDFNGAVNLTVGSLALDIAADRIYWTAFRSTLSEGASGVWSARLDGTGIQLVTDTSGSRPPTGIALDLQNGKVYWADYRADDNGDVRIYRANQDGSGYEVFLLNPPGLPSPGGDASIAVDPDAGKVYWGGVYGLHRANLDGSGVEAVSITEIASLNGLGFIAGDIDAQCHIPKADICPANADCSRQEMVYWGGKLDFGGSIWRARPDGSHVEKLIDTTDTVRGIVASRELGKLYWTQLPTDIYRANLDGTGAELVLSLPFAGAGEYVQDIALDEATGKLFIAQKRRDGFSGAVSRSRCNIRFNVWFRDPPRPVVGARCTPEAAFGSHVVCAAVC